MSRTIPPDYFRVPPPWPWQVGRIDAPALIDVEGVDYVFAVQHQPDKTNKCVHMHVIIETELSHKRLRSRIREAYGLRDKMDIFFAPFNWTKLTKCVTYYIDHDHAQVLRQEDCITPYVEIARQMITTSAQIAKANQDFIDQQTRELEQLNQRHIEMWGHPYPEAHAGHKYVDVINRIEAMTQHWSSEDELLSFKNYATRVLRYVTWSEADDYRHIYSEYRFRGDIKLLYCRYWGVTPDLTVQIFGHL